MDLTRYDKLRSAIRRTLSPNDTIKFEIHIIDRALHESNTIQTDPIFTNPTLNK